MEINNLNKPLLAGVIGDPIYQSKSPILHNFWLKKYNINGYYIPIHVHKDTLLQSIKALISLGFRGVNVTIPHKTKILSIADTITDRAAIIGAANTLYFNSDGKITADNTDGYGFKQNIYHFFSEWNPKHGPVVILGAGGAAKAVVYTLLLEGVPQILISNRTKAKASEIAGNFGTKVKVIDWHSIEGALKEACLLINTTSLGMIGQPKLKLNIRNLKSKALVTDLVYNPINTQLLNDAKKLGLHTVDGLGMLLYQAQLGFSNWFNVNPKINDDLKNFMIDSGRIN